MEGFIIGIKRKDRIQNAKVREEIGATGMK